MPEPSEKSRLRQRLRSRLPEDPVALSLRLLSHLGLLGAWATARKIQAYVAIRGEPDVLSPWPDGKEVALPRIEGEMLSFRVVARRGDLQSGSLGILEPGAAAAVAGDPDLILIPGLAFDAEGGRLGRGRGFYDRHLCGTPGIRVGVCFEESLIERVPCEPHDERMDYVVTPAGIITCGRKSRR